ncbi:MAG: alpha/beta hydrolase, partial [Erysipelotrichaceae bacterium]|nr:alpha/beta hydrolase [Erysipelotrichaceae bacterium]
LDDHLMVISIYGSEDEVLNMDKILEGRQYVTGRYVEYVIEGGNHAQFGNYGMQKGDGTASISAEYQQEQTVDIIIQNIK